MSEPAAELVHVAGLLRREGMAVPPTAVLDWAQACRELPDRDLYRAGRATLVKDRDEAAVFDRIYAQVFGDARSDAPSEVDLPEGLGQAEPVAENKEGDAVDDVAGALASALEELRHRDFAHCDEAELAALARLIARISLALPRRPSRRSRPDHGGRIDLRHSVRDEMRTAGVGAGALHRRRRRTRPRRLVLLLDVSGSMTDYARALLLFAKAATGGDHRVEVFCFGTRLTRVTTQLGDTDPERALAKAAACVLDWDGGTRIGRSLKQFLDEYGHRGLARGAVVLIASDGLERDDPTLLGHQMARLGRLAHTVVWLNPLRGDSRYEPLARGMRAALPHIEVFLSGHNLASLDELAALLPTLGPAIPTTRVPA